MAYSLKHINELAKNDPKAFVEGTEAEFQTQAGAGREAHRGQPGASPTSSCSPAPPAPARPPPP